VSLSALPPVDLVDGANSIRLHRRDLTLVNPVSTSHGDHTTRRVLLVEVRCADGTVGWGECGAPDDPGYTGETADAAANFLESHTARALAGRDDLAAGMVHALFGAVDRDASVRHPMALCALEMAVLDAQLRSTNTAFESMFEQRASRVAAAGATVGNIGSGTAIETAVADALAAVSDGYGRLKVKIGPRLQTTELIRELRAAIPDSILILGDANGSYGVDEVDHLASLGELGLDIVEQPFAAHDTASHQALVATGAIRVVLDEGVRSAVDALDAVVNHECTDVMLKPARFGYAACVDVLNRVGDHGAGAWIGGMFDTGVARWANVRLASHPGVTLPSDIGSSVRYWADDVTEPVVADAGFVVTPGARRAGLSGVPL